jgi:hypothetical protein
VLNIIERRALKAFQTENRDICVPVLTIKKVLPGFSNYFSYIKYPQYIITCSNETIRRERFLPKISAIGAIREAIRVTDLERELILLPAPNGQPRVISSKFPEPLGADGEKAASHHWAPTMKPHKKY